MRNSEPKDGTNSLSCPYATGMDFDEMLIAAECLFSQGEADAALNLLQGLERKYVAAARLFDLMAAVLIKQGNAEAAVRYKTIHDVLTGVFGIALGPADHYGFFKVQKQVTGEKMKPIEPGLETAIAAEPQLELTKEQTSSKPAEKPYRVTYSMGHEFLRQGQFDRAAEIFTMLAAKHPEDPSVKEIRDLAAKKSREKQLLIVFQNWLEKIERLKTTKPKAS